MSNESHYSRYEVSHDEKSGSINKSAFSRLETVVKRYFDYWHAGVTKIKFIYHAGIKQYKAIN